MDSTIEPPNELKLPVAYLKVLEAGDCGYSIQAVNSQLSDGTFITELTTGVSLEYTFTYLGIVFARATIAPGDDASNPDNWTLLSGSKSAPDWEFEFVDQFIGTGLDFTWSPIDLGGVLPNQLLYISLRIVEGSTTSIVGPTGVIVTCSPGIGTMIIGRTFLVD